MHQLSGGHIDGDDFLCICDPQLLPTEGMPCMKYDNNKPKEMNKYVDMEMCMKYWLDYQIYGSVGIIAELHEALGFLFFFFIYLFFFLQILYKYKHKHTQNMTADASDLGVGSPQCIELSVAHSRALDYAKTGVSAEIPSCMSDLKKIRYPHHMQKPWQVSYESTAIKEKLYEFVRIPQHHWNDKEFRKQWGFKFGGWFLFLVCCDVFIFYLPFFLCLSLQSQTNQKKK